MRGAVRFLAEVLAVVARIAPDATVVIRADSRFYTAKVVATAARYGARVSLTTGSNPDINATIAAIPNTAWTPIHYPQAFVDTDTAELISDAAGAEVPNTAFVSKPATRCPSPPTTRCCKPKPSTATTPSSSRSSPMRPPRRWRHLSSGVFNADAAWAVLWAISHNLTRAAGALASMFHARATTATIRAHLINVPARLARGARRITLHMPDRWPWQAAWTGLHAAVPRPDHRPPGHDPRNQKWKGRADRRSGHAHPRQILKPMIQNDPKRSTESGRCIRVSVSSCRQDHQPPSLVRHSECWVPFLDRRVDHGLFPASSEHDGFSSAALLASRVTFRTLRHCILPHRWRRAHGSRQGSKGGCAWRDGSRLCSASSRG